jgi:hypothetical protein
MSKTKGIWMKPIIIILIVFGIQLNCYGQQDQFYEFNTARFSRIIGLGNAFTGLADDIESVYYNSAGIANLEYYAAIYSKGHGFALIIDDYKADDLAIILPVLKKLGIFAFSVHRFTMLHNTHSENIYRLHFARFLFTNFSVGTSLNYYHFHFEPNSRILDKSMSKEVSGSAFDMSVSALYSIPVTFIPGINNETRFGLQMQNLFDTDMHYSENMDPNSKHQALRVGLSTALIPKIQKQINLTPLKLIIVADAILYGSGYKFSLFQPNYGLELAFFEILKFRYGRENELVIGDSYDYSPQHPVKRYGIGVTLPLHKFISGFNKLELSIDYSYSDWDQIDESKPLFPSLFKDLPIRDSFSIKIYYQN